MLAVLAKGVLLFLKRSTPFHKEILPTFTKQLRKNYTIIALFLLRALQIYPINFHYAKFTGQKNTNYDINSTISVICITKHPMLFLPQAMLFEMSCYVDPEVYAGCKNKYSTKEETA